MAKFGKLASLFTDPVEDKNKTSVPPVEQIIPPTVATIETEDKPKDAEAEEILNATVNEDGEGIFRVKKLVALLGHGMENTVMAGALEAGGAKVEDVIKDGETRIVAIEDRVFAVQEQNRVDTEIDRAKILELEEARASMLDEIEERKANIKRRGTLDAALNDQSATVIAELRRLIKVVTIKKEEV